jgi:hypothetical protein
MGRRQFLGTAAGLGAAALTLAGCGSGGGSIPVEGPDSGGGTAATRTANGRVVLPAGFALPVTGLTAHSGLGTGGAGTLPADGAFAVPVLGREGAGPTLAWITAGDDVVLLGFIGAGEGAGDTIGVASTALALLYFALGGPSLPADSRSALLRSVAADPALPPLARVLEERLAADPRALLNGDAAVGDALRAALGALGATTAQDRKHAAPTNRGRQQAGPAAQLLIQPSGFQSNVELVQGDAGTQNVVATNHARRYCRVFAYQTGFKDKSTGARTDYPAVKASGGAVPLPATSALGVFSTVTNFLSGQTAFVPVSTLPIPLEMAADASQTFYDVVVLGASSRLTEPAFFAEPKYAPFVGEWRTAVARLNLTSWVADVLLGLALEIWGLRDIAKNEAAIEAAVAAVNAEGNVFFGIAELAAQGKFAEATKAFLLGLAGSVQLALRLRAVIAPFLTSIGGVSVSAAEASAGAQAVVKVLSAALNVAGLLLGAGDLGAVLYDLSSAERGDRWGVTQVERVVTLSPATAELPAGGTLALTAKVPGGEKGTGTAITYHWSVAAAFAVLTDTAGGKSGRDFETASAAVQLVTTPSDQGRIVVTVEAFATEGGVTRSLGSAQATVTLSGAQNVAGAVVFEDYSRADYLAAGYSLSFDGVVVNSFVVPVDKTTGYYLVRTSPDSTGRRTGYKVRAADFLSATSIGERIPPVQGVPGVAASVVEPIPGVAQDSREVRFHRRGDTLYFNLTERGYPFYPSIALPPVTDGAGAEAWLRDTFADRLSHVEVTWFDKE